MKINERAARNKLEKAENNKKNQANRRREAKKVKQLARKKKLEAFHNVKEGKVRVEVPQNIPEPTTEPVKEEKVSFLKGILNKFRK